MAVGFDWSGFEQFVTDAVVQTVRRVVAERPDQRFYAAAFAEIYRETDGVISMPLLGMNTVEAVDGYPDEDREDLRWSPPDWQECDVDWLPEREHRRWADALTTF